MPTKATIVLTDCEDGTVDLEVKFDPKLNQDDPALSHELAVHAVNHLTERLRSGDATDGSSNEDQE